MKKKAIKVLEYSKIINRLMEKAGSEMTKNIISELMPYKNISMADVISNMTTKIITRLLIPSLTDTFFIFLEPFPPVASSEISPSCSLDRKSVV